MDKDQNQKEEHSAMRSMFRIEALRQIVDEQKEAKQNEAESEGDELGETQKGSAFGVGPKRTNDHVLGHQLSAKRCGYR